MKNRVKRAERELYLLVADIFSVKGTQEYAEYIHWRVTRHLLQRAPDHLEKLKFKGLKSKVDRFSEFTRSRGHFRVWYNAFRAEGYAVLKTKKEDSTVPEEVASVFGSKPGAIVAIDWRKLSKLDDFFDEFKESELSSYIRVKARHKELREEIAKQKMRAVDRIGDFRLLKYEFIKLKTKCLAPAGSSDLRKAERTLRQRINMTNLQKLRDTYKGYPKTHSIDTKIENFSKRVTAPQASDPKKKEEKKVPVGNKAL